MTPSRIVPLRAPIACLTGIAVAALLGSPIAAQDDDAVPAEPHADAAAEQPENPFEASEVSLRLGKQVYDRFCVTCHGHDGKGQTDTVQELAVKPRDFTKGEYKYGSADHELFAVIRDGTETGMESFKAKLPDARIWHVINYVRSLGPGKEGVIIRDEVPENPMEYTRASVTRGLQYYRRFCISCHGERGKGDTEMREFLSTHPSDFTDRSWKYGERDGDLFLVIKNGTEYDMEAFEGRLTDDNIWHVVNYLRNLEGKELD